MKGRASRIIVIIVAAGIVAIGVLSIRFEQARLKPKRFIAGQVAPEANEIRVTSTDQDYDENGRMILINGTCTLVEAFRSANENRAYDACPAGSADLPDTIILEANTTYTLNRPFSPNVIHALFNRGETILEGNGATIVRADDARSEFRLIYSSRNLTVRNTTFRGGNVRNLEFANSKGGAILHVGELTVEDCQFAENSAQDGGAIYSRNSGREAFATLTIVGSLFTGNSATRVGGALYMQGNGSILSSHFINNTGVMAGAVFRDTAGLRIPDPDRPGQFTLSPDKPMLVIKRSFFRGNRANQDAGAIYNRGKKCDLGDNVNAWAAMLTVVTSSFDGNESGGYGGAIGNGGIAEILSSSLVNNRAGTIGGGIANIGQAPCNAIAELKIRNTSISQNHAGTSGGGIASSLSHATILNSTIAGNETSDGESAGLSLTSSEAKVQNTILTGHAGNVCANIADGNSLLSQGHNILGNMAGCPFRTEEGAEGDLPDADAGLLALVGLDDNIPGNERHPLGPNSSAINAGDDSLCVDDADPDGPQLARDQLERDREGVCDIGALEAVCGDGVAHTPLDETCDDGNDVDTDNCLASCVAASCGDGIIHAGIEFCDDGNRDDGDNCPSTCQAPSCGDGIVQAGSGEACDDGNEDNRDGCLNSCITATCGDGIAKRDGEECDDGNPVDDDDCRNNCVAARCGDGMKQENEECDDGNRRTDDSCSNACRFFIAPAPALPPVPIGEEGGVMPGDQGASDPAQPDEMIDNETGMADGLEPTDIEGQTPSVGPTGGTASPPSSPSMDEEGGGNGGGGGCNLLMPE